MHYFNFNIGDYASHTRHLSLLEDLAYRRLIDAYYLSEKPFFGSPADIAKDIGMVSQIEEVFYVLSKFFEQSDDGSWFNKRCDEEIAHYHGKQEQAVKAGKASAQARLSKRSTSVQPTNNQEPITNNQLNTIVVAKAPKSTRFQKGFSIPDEWATFCLKERPELDIGKTFESFSDYWVSTPGTKGTKLDWFATWRNWVRNQKKALTPAKEEKMSNFWAQIEGNK
jgi:uncharacterized protein YdaU (DUF1376 family)